MKKCIRKIATLVSITALVACAATVHAADPTFTNVTATVAPGLPGMAESSVTWADYDNDGRLDFLVTGSFTAYSAEDGEPNMYYAAQLWRNTGSGFTNVTATVAPGLPEVYASAAAWGDYDNDGRLDVLITGVLNPAFDYGISQIWRNTGSGFTNVTATVAPGLLGVGYGSVAWGDYDNDGRLDFVIAGFTVYDDRQGISQVWRNTGGGFSNVTATVAPGLPGVLFSSVAWGDYDNDGRLDFILAGSGYSQLWRNTGNGFAEVTAAAVPGLPPLNNSSVAWADYDNDGRLDFIITGFDGNSNDAVIQLWRNTGSGFTNVTASVAPEWSGTYFNSVAWGDYDNDGRFDLLMRGNSPQLWRNTVAGFTNVTVTVAPGLTGAAAASHAATAAWSDYDNDGRLDLFLSGNPQQILRNNTPITNTPPSAPTGLAMTTTTNAVMLSWNFATDGQTPASGLTYNVRAGTTPGGNDLLSAHVNATNGFRRVPAMGNAMLRHRLPLTGLTNGQTVYWSVQAVDTAFAGGPFATETSVVSQPVLSVSLHSPPSTLNLSWTPPTFGWFLEQSPNVSGSNWTAAPSGSANPTTLPATNGAQFFRLREP